MNMVSSIRSIWREPLVWFLLAGLLLFGLHALVSPGEDVEASRVIRVDRNSLLQYMQLRARSFNESGANKLLEQMSPEDVNAMVNDMVREEAMYREGLRLGLDKNDYVLKRRLIQSLEYVADGASKDDVQPDEAALKRYYAAHRQRYVAVSSISFSHVFFSADTHGWDSAKQLAASARTALNSGRDTPEDLPSDRFLYLKDYAERNPELIEAHFGNDFARKLFTMKADDKHWQGPLRSKYGFHLVRIVAKENGRPLSFDEARAMVAGDAAKDANQSRRDAFAAGLLAQFNVDVSGDVRKLMTVK